MDLAGKAALVTGAGSGIGRATALALVHQGATVGVVDVERDRVDAVVGEIELVGGRAVGRVADVGSRESIEGAVHHVADSLDGLNVVVANAGINGVWAAVDEIELDEWDRTIAVNLTGTFLTIRAAVPHLRRDGGAIVVVSSIQGTSSFSVTGATAYGATKAAQVAMVKYLAVELGEHRIRVNAVCPGAVATNLEQNTEARGTDDLGVPACYPEGPEPLREGIADPAQIAEVIAFLASDRASRITGAAITVDGGESLVTG